MVKILFSNNARSTLAGAITNAATALSVASGEGAIFPSPSGGNYFLASLFDSTGLITEIVKVTARTGDAFTVQRAQEGTSALAWDAGSVIGNIWTAGQAGAMSQAADTQQQAGNFVATDTGTANNVIISLSPAPAAFGNLTGVPIRFIKSASANSGNVTVNCNSLGNVSLLHSDASQMSSGELAGSGLFEMASNGTAFVLQSMPASQAPAILSPTGAVTAFAGNVTPTGWLECNGGNISTSTYSALFAVIGYNYGGAGGNFTLPDLRGYFVRGWDDGRGVDGNRTLGSAQQDAFQGHYHSPLAPETSFRGILSAGNSVDANSGGANGYGNTTGNASTSSAFGTVRTATETRPINLALMYIIKT